MRSARHVLGSTRGFTLIELIIVCAILSILAGIVIHYLMMARAASNEASAIGTLRATNSAQMAFSSSCGRSAFAPSFQRLVDGNFASPDIALSVKSGYRFTMTPGVGGGAPPDCTALPTQTAYYASAEPVTVASGRRGFATSVGATIWEDTTGTPPAEPFTLTATVHPLARGQ
jgi:prepilin-type N-terminal cleavage/methylation domain-containing protein